MKNIDMECTKLRIFCQNFIYPKQRVETSNLRNLKKNTMSNNKRKRRKITVLLNKYIKYLLYLLEQPQILKLD